MVASPRELRAEDGCRDEMIDISFDGFFILSAHSLTLLISPPSTFTARGSAGFPKIVPLYLVSASVVVLCFFFSAT